MSFTSYKNLLNVAFNAAQKHFQDIVDEYKDMCRGYSICLQLLPTLGQMENTLRSSIGNEFSRGAKALTKPEIDKIVDGAFKSSNSALASTMTDYERRYDKIHVSGGKIIIAFNKGILLEDIVNNLWRFDEYLSVRLKMVARHEFGHVVQYIRNDGITYDEYLKKETGMDAVLSDDGDPAPYNGTPEYSIDTQKAESLGFKFTDINDWIFDLLDYYIDVAHEGMLGLYDTIE